MSDHAATRRELERSLRALVPERTSLGGSLTSSKSSVAAAGFGGLVTGYLWGWIRGRRARKRS